MAATETVSVVLLHFNYNFFIHLNNLIYYAHSYLLYWCKFSQCAGKTCLTQNVDWIPAEDLQAGERGGIEDAPEPKDKVQVLKDQVDGVTNIMTQNVDRILARGERLDNIKKISEDLQAGAQNFHRTAVKVSRSYWWKNVKLIVVIVVVMLIIVLIIILLTVR
ncbi:vesicle-associated membrane protein 8-like, partial [Girardinichthys multiradiatus]|uniref:vesicle-associated membrane protein 8-like n=1 Tax=Girardinichthys multiradiatus TaxID=208333 RepID=UPI001FADDB2A